MVRRRWRISLLWYYGNQTGHQGCRPCTKAAFVGIRRLAKLVPDKIPDKKLNLPNAIAYVPELQAAEASPDPLVRDTLKYAKMLEGNVRGTGVHACGTIICRDDITDWVPVSTADDKETGEKMLVTQYEGSVIEDTGLIKMDFLGLKTLSIIKEAN